MSCVQGESHLGCYSLDMSCSEELRRLNYTRCMRGAALNGGGSVLDSAAEAQSLELYYSAKKERTSTSTSSNSTSVHVCSVGFDSLYSVLRGCIVI